MPSIPLRAGHGRLWLPWLPGVKQPVNGFYCIPDAGKRSKAGRGGDDRGWHYLLNGYEFEETPRVGDGRPGVLRSMGCKESDTAEQLK